MCSMRSLLTQPPLPPARTKICISATGLSLFHNATGRGQQQTDILKLGFFSHQLKLMRLKLIPAVLDSLKTKQRHRSKGSWETWQASCETGSVDTRVTGWWESDAFWWSVDSTPELRGVKMANLSNFLKRCVNFTSSVTERKKSS